MGMMGGGAAVPGGAAPAQGQPQAQAAKKEEAPKEEEKKEKTHYDIELTKFDGAKKIALIKEIRAILNLGLKEAKDLVEAGGKAVKEGVSKAEAEDIKKKLEAAGAKVELK